jgi:hypothetical protein
VDLTVIVGTFGDESYRRMAVELAAPSAESQAATVHYHHEDPGATYGQQLADCRNIPARAATTEWLAFLDADDELMPGFVEAMDQATGDLRTPAVSYVRPGRGPARPMFWPERDIRDSNYLIVTTLMRREEFLALGGFRDVPLYEDWDLFQRFIKAGASVERVPGAVCRVHIRPGSLHRRGSTRHDKQHAHEVVRRLNFPELYAEDAA